MTDRSFKISQRAHAGTEIVERELAPEVLQGPQEVLRLLEIPHRGGLGQFEAQHVRRKLARLLIFLDERSQEGIVLKGLARQVDREARDVLAHRGAVRAEQLAGAVHDPAIDRRHELIALRRGQEFARAE